MIFEMAMAGLAGAATAQAAAGTVPLVATEVGAPAVEPIVAGAELRIPAKTVVQIAITEPISSKLAQIGDSFAISLAEPLTIGDRIIIPAGVEGRGEVTHAAKSGWGGRAGELIVNARYLTCGNLRIPLGHFQYAGTGKDNFGGAFVAAQVIPLGQFMVNGGEASIPAGVRGTAKVKADVVLTAEALRGCMKPAD